MIRDLTIDSKCCIISGDILKKATKRMSQFSDICKILLKSGKICYKYGDGPI